MRREWAIAELPSSGWPEPCPCPDRVASRVVVDGIVVRASSLPRPGRSAALTRVLVARAARLDSEAVYRALNGSDADAIVHYLTCPACSWHVVSFRATRDAA